MTQNTIENKQCKRCLKSFSITKEDREFYDKISPIFNGKKYDIPNPDLCPNCRCQERVMYRNEATLYHNKSAKSGKNLISLYSLDKPYKIFSEEERTADDRDAITYGCDFDFSKNFFDQYHDLDLQIPRTNLMTVVGTNENSPYTTGTGYCKNCHMINSSENDEDCYYGKLIQTCKDVVDSSYIYDSDLIYEGFNLRDCHNCFYLSFSKNCTNCHFSENLTGCTDCFLCTNLVQKQFCILNKQYTKEEYEEVIQEYLGSHTNIKKAKKALQELKKTSFYKYSNILSSENSSGDFVQNCKNCEDCYDITDSEDCKYVQVGVSIKDVMDSSNMYIKPELCYQDMGTLEVHNVIFSIYVFHSTNVMYSQQCYDCNNLFGCSGLRNKEYCILNKQYSKEEYEILVAKIIEHMQTTGERGSFFPPKYAPYGYNESLAMDYFTITKEKAQNLGFPRHNEESQSSIAGEKNDIPETIQEVQDDICSKIFSCEITAKPYKIIPQELKFYRKNNIPLPKRCPTQRHMDRMSLRNPRSLRDRKCDKCGVDIKSTYSPERSEKVYCETCYNKEIYG